jgi:hypothetical protein
MTASLGGVWRKLDRAEYHLDALNAEIREFFERGADDQTFVARHNVLDDSWSAVFKAKPLPEDWGVKLGDVIHNMRSALDHLVAQLVLLANASVHSRHQFPIFDDPDDWQRRVVQPPQNRQRGFLDFIDPQHVAVIESLQPYQPSTGLPTLATISRFSNADKHRLIHAARTNLTAKPALGASVTIPANIREVRYQNPGATLEDGAEVARYRADFFLPVNPLTGPQLPSNAEVNVSIHLKVTTVFGEPGKEDTRIRDFGKCLADARAIIDRFVGAFP